jgi:glycosyltransferase involved in cell wall biosynthesis
MVHVVYLNYLYDAQMASLEQLLETYSTMAGWVEALHQEGAEVTVFQRFHREATVLGAGVRFRLLSDRYGPQLRKWEIPWSLHQTIRKHCAATASKAEPTVVHFNSLIFPLQLRALRAALPRESAIVVQHHAEKPSRGLRRQVQKWGLRAADGFFFAASQLAPSWIEQGLIRSAQPVYQVMEGSTTFRRQDRGVVRAQTSLTGDPVVLWVGRLIALKDPLTVLRGFESVLAQAPKARLYMLYGSDDLLPQVQDCIRRSHLLSKAVVLLGSVPYPKLESIYNSADYFVLGSHYEGSGYSLAEAMACGVVPVVTDIPSFRAITDGGQIGACWQPGDSAAFAAAFLRVWRQPVQLFSDLAVQFFAEHLSFPAIARRAIQAYGELAVRRANERL